jgi:arginine-tRNA-protein transferase
MRLLERIVERPHPCAYLPTERASLEVRVMLDVSGGEMDALLERGWRRFGPTYFRPACARCNECVSLRVLADQFVPNKTQRRTARAARCLRRVLGPPRVDDERLALYAKWHQDRERTRGWEPNAQTRERYALEFAFPHPTAREATFYDDHEGGRPRLVGVGIFDATPTALSAAFFYHDPAYARWSLGTANILTLIEDAKKSRRKHVYLGYQVDGCESLRYKAAFRPHELLLNLPESLDEAPEWVTAGTEPLDEPSLGR